MTTTVLLSVVLGLYLAGIFALSLVAVRRVHNEEDYLVAGRRLPLSLAWATLIATWFGAATVLGAAEAAREDGVRGTLLDPFASGGALILAGLFFARPLWEMRLLTISDFYGRVFGPKSEVTAAVIVIPGYFGWVAAQYIALGGLQDVFFGIDADWGILFAAAIVLVYTIVGGMWSVTVTDALQLVIALVTLVILAWTAFSHLGDGAAADGVSRLWGETPSGLLTLLPEPGLAAGLVWLATLGSGLFGNIPGQDLMQRVFASKDARTAVRACVLAGVLYIAFGLLPVGLGLASRILVPEADGAGILGVLAQEYLTPTLTVVFVVALVSIIVSTCTSAVLSPAAVLGHNLLGRLPGLKSRPLTVDRFSVLIITLCSLFVAYSGKTIIELLELSLSIVLVSLFVPLVMGLYGNPNRHNERSALLAMIFGCVVWLPREWLEGFHLPLPDDVAERGIEYADYVRSVYPPARVGTIVCECLYWFALIPSALSGTAASFIGYVMGGKSKPGAQG